MMYDDIAFNAMNPFQGKIFNQPANASSGEGPLEVYAGCKIDYRGDDVTPENFLSVLMGNATATNGKKVLASGSDDRVFVNFVDHGAPGVVVFPNEQLLTAKQLTGTLEKMYEQKRYKELVFYVEGDSTTNGMNTYG
jgi:legumain